MGMGIIIGDNGNIPWPCRVGPDEDKQRPPPPPAALREWQGSGAGGGDRGGQGGVLGR